MACGSSPVGWEIQMSLHSLPGRTPSALVIEYGLPLNLWAVLIDRSPLPLMSCKEIEMVRKQ
jgi:hypothetical protein